MKKFLKWVGIVLAALVGLIILALIVIYFRAEARLDSKFVPPREALTVPTDDAPLAYGKRIFQFRGCEACHGEQLEGKVYLSDPALGEVNASNLTTGLGGVGGGYTDADWVAAIRYGIRPDGTPLLFMPSTEFYFFERCGPGGGDRVREERPACGA
jgi:mono/diheme cytochrome c family protein